MENRSAAGTVLVTGGSGFIASWIIIRLLQQGYVIRSTIRHRAREASVRAAITTQVDPGNRLTFHAADLLQDDGWSKAVEGADFVIHVASPMPVGEYKKTDVISPAREGTVRVLKAAADAGVQRVVLTSSLVAAMPAVFHEGVCTDETVWTDLSGKYVNDYTKAKTLAEQDAWSFIGQQEGKMTLTTILPGMVQGPVLSADYSGSVELVERMMTGKIPRFPRIGFSVIDVRDLADLHIRAMESKAAAGERFIGTSDFLWFSDIARILRTHFGGNAAKVPDRMLPDWLTRLLACFNPDMRFFVPNLGQRRQFSTQKAAAVLGWQPRRSEEAVIASAESLIRQSLI